MLKYWVLIYWMFLTVILSAQLNQSIKGVWKGELTQKSGDFAETYAFEMYVNIQFKEGRQLVDGRTYIRAKDAFGEMSFIGKMINNTLFVEEKELLHSNEPNMLSWCYKKMQLQLKKEGETWTLQGDWEGDSVYGYCLPGSIVLKKIKPQA